MAEMISADVVGLSAWTGAVRRTEGRMDRANWRATRLAMAVMEKRVKLYLRTFTHPEGTPTPSPPGGPPALVTGNLARSWRNRGPRLGLKPGVVEMEGGPTTVYARIQELGGQTGKGGRTRLPARPYVSPMVRAVRREVRRIYLEQWRKALDQ